MWCFGRRIICLLKRSQASEVQNTRIKNRNKRSVFLLIDHFVIDGCKLCNKEWKPLAMVWKRTVCVT